MALNTLSLPVDIPWRRLCVSDDMIDEKVCDREFPPRWQSSVAVFTYEPPPEHQTYDGFTVSYLKIAYTITGYQPDDPTEISLRERHHYTYFQDPKVAAALIKEAARYYPCHGAILEVAVKPVGTHPKSQYPYFINFEPKKRELYELVTETGETLSRSLDEVNIQKGTTTTVGTEVLDSDKKMDWSGLGAIAGGVAGGAAGGPLGAAAGAGLGGALGGLLGAGGETGVKDINQTQRSNHQLTDRSREIREMFSHSTQLSQMYHQFSSYHLGTNRAVFYLLPRPHTVQTEFTFVNGPRELEGIQEILLVVMRPEKVKELCVEAYLETAHVAYDETDENRMKLTKIVEIPTTKADWYLTIQAGNPGETTKLVDIEWAIPAGWEFENFTFKEHPVYGPNATQIAPVMGGLDTVWLKEVTADLLTFSAAIHPVGWKSKGGDWYELYYAAGVLLKLELRKSGALPTSRPTDLYLTGRGVCCCQNVMVRLDDPTVTAEVAMAEVLVADQRSGMSMKEANRMRVEIGRRMLESINDPGRYARGAVRFVDTKLLGNRIARLLDRPDHPDNHILADIVGLQPELRDRLAASYPRLRRADILKMEILEIRDRFELTHEETIHLRRSALGFEGPSAPPSERWDPPSLRVPDLLGLPLVEAVSALRDRDLVAGSISRQDSVQQADTVLDQDPAAGEVPRGIRYVDLILSTGLSVQIPRVVGKPLSEALCMLRDAGLRSEPELKFVRDRERPANTVIEIEPAERTHITPNAPVVVRVARESRG